jgi:hypothetical protein
MLRGRRSATALADDARQRGSDIAESLGSTAADTVSDLAEKAAEIAREAQKAASPVIRSAMATAAERARDAQHAASPVMRSAAATAAGALSDAAEHAAEVLGDAAERLAQAGAEQAGDLQITARHRIADASEELARRIRPKRRRRALRIVLIGGGVAGVGAGVWFSPLGDRLRAMLGMTPAEEPAPPAPSIVLPDAETTGQSETGAQAGGDSPAGANGDRVLTGGRGRSSAKKS